MIRKAKSRMRMPRGIGSPVLDSLGPVIRASRFVRTDARKIAEHAGWLAYEELPFPNFVLPFGVGGNPEEAIDFVMVVGLINFAFTDFRTRRAFTVEYGGKRWSDAEAMFACLKRAADEGVAVLDGAWLARASAGELARIFRGDMEMPMLAERAEIFREAGKVLNGRYGGRFHNFFGEGSRRLYDNGRGMLERLIREFPRFNDVSRFGKHEIKFYKLAQLAIWVLHASLRYSGGFPVEDISKMTAFADYIVPVALRVMGILRYAPSLEKAIQSGKLLERDSREEIEIRAHTLHATALLREEVNKLRPRERQVIIPQIDARLWTHYHTTHWPHHLTRTIMY
ncbi:MAG: queuosine salvage family protein [Acidobacteriia bacterium]|nr:queuosine salvage family protein [Terriglobia bacterium]